MTEHEWVTATDPTPLLKFLRDRGVGSDRKLRLFAVACRRAVLNPFTGAFPDRVLQAAEAFADGDLPREVLDRVHAAALAAGPPPVTAYQANLMQAVAHAAAPDIRTAAPLAAQAAAYAAADLPAGGDRAPSRREGGHAEYTAERAAQADLVRDTFSGPSASVGFDPEWRTAAVLDLARQMYGARDFTLAPILADALQDAGCRDDRLLDHLRGPGPHARGCDALDHILGLT